MKKRVVFTLMALLFVPLVGCGRSGENQVIQGAEDEITPEMIATEEEELETTE